MYSLYQPLIQISQFFEPLLPWWLIYFKQSQALFYILCLSFHSTHYLSDFFYLDFGIIIFLSKHQYQVLSFYSSSASCLKYKYHLLYPQSAPLLWLTCIYPGKTSEILFILYAILFSYSLFNYFIFLFYLLPSYLYSAWFYSSSMSYTYFLILSTLSSLWFRKLWFGSSTTWKWTVSTWIIPSIKGFILIDLLQIEQLLWEIFHPPSPCVSKDKLYCLTVYSSICKKAILKQCLKLFKY